MNFSHLQHTNPTNYLFQLQMLTFLVDVLDSVCHFRQMALCLVLLLTVQKYWTIK